MGGSWGVFVRWLLLFGFLMMVAACAERELECGILDPVRFLCNF